MERPSHTAGYESVNFSDESAGEKEANVEMTDKLNEAGPMLAEKGPSATLDSTHTGFNDERTFMQKCNSFWVWELVSSAISMGCLGVVIWALVYLDGSPYSAWTLTMQPASFISTFVTISRFMMMVGVAEAIAQLRWLYYLGGPRRLDHLDSFDSASRGPWGSFLFTCRQSIRGTAPSVGRVGAIITIIALAMDPFAQQILVKPRIKTEHYYNSTEAWMLASNEYNHANPGLFHDYSERQLIYGGLLGYSYNISMGCASGNCTWSPFASIGYCFTCEDIESTAPRTCVSGAGILDQDCTAVQYVLPNSNLSLTLFNGSTTEPGESADSRAYTLLQSSTSDPHPLGLQDPMLFQFLIAQLRVDRLTSDTFNTSQLANPSWNVTGCSLNYCSKVYEGLSMTNRTLHNVPPRDLPIVALKNSPCWTDSSLSCQEFTPEDPSAVPSGSNLTYRAVVTDNDVSIRSFLEFDYTIHLNGSDQIEDSEVTAAYNLATGLFWNVNITGIFGGLADAVTDWNREISNPSRVLGTMDIDGLYYNVQWQWFALPALAVLAGCAFLIWVIIYTVKGVNGERFIWKANTIPLLMHGLQGYQRHGYAGAESTGAIFRKARQMTVQLKRNEDGEIRFVRAE